MRDRYYLLSLEELGNEPASAVLLTQCMNLLDEERKKRARQRLGAKQKESVGAGLLLQLMLFDALMDAEEQDGIAVLSVTDAVKRLSAGKAEGYEVPIPANYRYGANGKPYLANYPYHFNLSHSGGYVFGVISEQEVGVDIQMMRPVDAEKLSGRFFAEKERALLQACGSEEEQAREFFRMWTKKEAFGKLTGEGLMPVVGYDMSGQTSEAENALEIWEGSWEDCYLLAVCKRKQES